MTTCFSRPVCTLPKPFLFFFVGGCGTPDSWDNETDSPYSDTEGEGHYISH